MLRCVLPCRILHCILATRQRRSKPRGVSGGGRTETKEGSQRHSCRQRCLIDCVYARRSMNRPRGSSVFATYPRPVRSIKPDRWPHQRDSCQTAARLGAFDPFRRRDRCVTLGTIASRVEPAIRLTDDRQSVQSVEFIQRFG